MTYNTGEEKHNTSEEKHITSEENIKLMEVIMATQLLFLIIITAVIIQIFSLRNRLSKLIYSFRIVDRRVEIGEIFTIEPSVINKKSMTIHNIELIMRLPLEIDLRENSKGIKSYSSFIELRNNFFIRRREELIFKIKASLTKRGIYSFGDCRLEKTDFLGYKTINTERNAEDFIIAFPARLDNNELDIVLDGFYGDYIVKNKLIIDQTLIRGYRDYTGVEPLKSISWSQTAKYNNFIVKEYDFTQEQKVTVILDASYRNDFGSTNDNLEICFSIARTACEFMDNRHIDFSFISNAFAGDIYGNIISIKSSGRSGHALSCILDILAISTYKQSCSLTRYMEYLSSALKNEGESYNSIIYICTSRDTESDEYINKQKFLKNTSIHYIYAEDYKEKVI